MKRSFLNTSNAQLGEEDESCSDEKKTSVNSKANRLARKGWTNGITGVPPKHDTLVKIVHSEESFARTARIEDVNGNEPTSEELNHYLGLNL